MTTIVPQYVDLYYQTRTLLKPLEDMRSILQRWLNTVEQDVEELLCNVFDMYLRGTNPEDVDDQKSLTHIYSAWAMMFPEHSAKFLSFEGLTFFATTNILHCHFCSLFAYLTVEQKSFLQRMFPELYAQYMMLNALNLPFNANTESGNTEQIDIDDIDEITDTNN